MKTIQHNGNYLQYGPAVIPALRENQDVLLLAEKNYSVSTESTTAASVGSFEVDGISVGDVIAIEIRDTAGRRSNYFIGQDQFCFIKGSGSNTVNYCSIADNAGTFTTGTSSVGVYCSGASLSSGKLTITISSKYNASSSKTINSTYRVRVYKVKL